MALPMLVGGADCGPINPLQGLSKELDRDRGLQQVCRVMTPPSGRDLHLIAGSVWRGTRRLVEAGASPLALAALPTTHRRAQAFRSQYAAAPGADQDAARFFSAAPAAAGPSSLGAAPYDLSALHTALPPLAAAQSPVQSPPALGAPAAPWAADFLQLQGPSAQIAHTQSFRADAEAQLAQSRQHAPVDTGVLNSPFQGETRGHERKPRRA